MKLHHTAALAVAGWYLLVSDDAAARFRRPPRRFRAAFAMED
jgi:hypothetical protein